MGQGPSLFEHYNFNGKKLQASVGDWQGKDTVSYPNFVNLGWNDVASSLQVPDGYYVDLYEHVDYAGDVKRFGPGDYPNFGNLGWNDKASSAVFVKGTPPAPPAPAVPVSSVPLPAPTPIALAPAQMPQSQTSTPGFQNLALIGSNNFLPQTPLQGGNQLYPSPARVGPLVNVTGTWLNEEARQQYNITDHGDSIDIPTADGVERLRVQMRTPQQLRAENMNKVFVSNGQNAQFSDRRIRYTINLVKAPSSTAPATVAPFTPTPQSGPDEANRDRYQGMTNLLIDNPDEYNMITTWYAVPAATAEEAAARRARILGQAQVQAARNPAAATQLAVNMGFLRPAPAGQRRDVSGDIALWLKSLADTAPGLEAIQVVIQQPAGAMGAFVTLKRGSTAQAILGVVLLAAAIAGGIYLYRQKKQKQG